MYVADFFSGHGGVARAVRQRGFATREWELAHGGHCDLTHPAVLFKVKQDIADKKVVVSAMLAPPWSSFSMAHDRTGVIRTKEHPCGVPGLCAQDAEKVRDGNACFTSAFKIIKVSGTTSCALDTGSPRQQQVLVSSKVR